MDATAELLGQAPSIVALREQIRRTVERTSHALRPPPILLQGETGTGKSLVARLLHHTGARCGGPFVDVNCAAIPEGLLEAELFGFERGAFTDARQPKAGLFQSAHGGTIFLDELSLLSDALQAKLLKVIEERVVRRLGGTRPERVDVSIIAAANVDLRAAVGARRFREDLYHRFAVLIVSLPPLRERADDIPMLAEHFLGRACRDYGLAAKSLTPAARAALCAYRWPGNVRELANVMERAALLTETSRIGPEMFQLPTESVPLDSPAASTAARGAPLGARMEALEREALRSALEETSWNVARAALRLGITRGTIRYRIAKYELTPRSRRPRRSPSTPPATPPPKAPVPPVATTRWEPRLVAWLEAAVRPVPEHHTPVELGGDLDVVVQKVASFAGRIEDVAPARIVAAFGVDPSEDAPRRAALAAMAIQNAVGRARESQTRPAELTIAIHAEHCSVAEVSGRAQIDGDAKRRATMVLEELRAHAEPDAAVVSETARSFLGRRFDFAEPADSDARPARGRQLLGYQQHRFGVGGHPGPFVGRDQELGILRTRWRDAVQGRGQIVALVGEPGIGKSRLLFEFRRALGDEPLTYLEGRGESYGAGIPYLPVIELLKVHFGIGERDDPPATGDKVTGRFAPRGEAIAADASPFLVLLSAPGADPEWQELEPAQRRQRTLDALTRFVLSLSQAQPVMLAIEDLHWIDAETQAFLDRLVVSLPAARVLVLVSYRPEYGHTWGGKSSYTQLRLDPLATASAEELARSLVGADAALQPLTRLLVERTEGNPFFLEESIRTLIETRGLVAERGAYRPGPDVHALEVPPTVRAVLAARIDRLPPEDRQLLQAAAVIGKDVPFALLRAIADVPEPMLQRMLTSLQSAEFLHPTRILPEIEYTFKHALTHDVAYEALPPDRQRALHGRILDAIEKLCADRLTEQVERLAHHAVRGAIWDRAARYLRRAGEKAVARSANREAMALFEQALAALQQLPESPETLSEALNIRIALGPCNGWVHGQAAREYEASHLAARELCLRLDDRPRLFSALWGLWHVSFNRGLYRDARGLAEGLLSLARELGDPVLVLEAHHSLWSSLYGSGDLEAAELHTREGLAQYDSQRHRAYAAVYGGHDTGVCCLNFAALTAWARGYPDRALRYTQNALQLAGQLSHAQSMALALYYAAVVHYHRREHQATVEKAGAALDTAVVHGHRFSADRSAFLARLGLEGTLEESDLTQLHQTARPPWWRWDHTFGFCLLAEAYARAGLPDKGLEVLAEIPEHALETPFGPDVYRCRGELLLGRGDTDPSGAETCFRSAIELARRGGHRSLELRATTSLSRLLAQRGRRDEGRQALGKVYGWFTEGFDTGDLRVARTLLDSLERPGAGA